MTNDDKNPGSLIQIKKVEDVCPGKKDKLSLDAVRERIDFAIADDAAQTAENKTGPQYWRSLQELAGSEEFQQALHREFPKGASEWLDTVSRRGFLKVMGASLGLAGLTSTTGCVRLPLEPIVPYVRQPGSGRKPSRPSDEDRRQRPASRVARRHRHLYPGRNPGPLRSRPLADGQLSGRRALVAAFSQRPPRPDERAKNLAGCRHSHSDADHFFAHARRPAARLPEELSAGQVARLRAGQSRQRPRRREAGLRTAGRDPLRFLESRRNRLPRRRLPLRRIPRQHPLHPRLCQAPQSRQRQHEPPVRNRKHADEYGSESRSPAANSRKSYRELSPDYGRCGSQVLW